ncbi:uncharacterized protein A1O9_12237 [Exophiala aquamarina CBS 119918]|uniref:Zn(2)-C6 fungal-type domain-containing protein n=1 Tax=Exophiala aquamarina CBS 119918 TaxID=1182545 RepID=A0A072NW13_9EURO|nr:uncharacterized protein A1O9_12237 [Exophiala aquamarina CBS 119918]KEF51602.1 hypothetical protein A1O9_12237 [Exophiala aquamarina CBS 119918]
MTLRSHHGCARCKKRRQKCDEEKPSCTRCIEAEVNCEYLLTLKWDGRVPRQQHPPRRKKKRADTETSDLHVDQSRQSSLERSVAAISSALPDQPFDGVRHVRELSLLSSWVPTERLLWDHFLTTASMVASHSRLREQICQQILPMAMQIPSLMYGTLALSALHRFTLLNEVPDGFTPEVMVSNLMSRSLKHLREELGTGSPRSRLLLLHTIRTLCVCEIYSGKADSAWRIHVDGARAILISMRSMIGLSEDDEQGWLTSRWYSSMEALTALTHRGTIHGTEQKGETLYAESGSRASQDDFLDIYTGYSSDLNSVFKDIGILSEKRRRLTASYDLQLADDLQSQSSRLEGILREMIRRDNEEGLKIPPNITLPRDQLRQFNACNVAYQYSALLHIHRRLQRRDSDSPEVQASVQKILETVHEILPMEALSPWALLTTPIFTAG